MCKGGNAQQSSFREHLLKARQPVSTNYWIRVKGSWEGANSDLGTPGPRHFGRGYASMLCRSTRTTPAWRWPRSSTTSTRRRWSWVAGGRESSEDLPSSTDPSRSAHPPRQNRSDRRRFSTPIWPPL